jgi:hypothetical protein
VPRLWNAFVLLVYLVVFGLAIAKWKCPQFEAWLRKQLNSSATIRPEDIGPGYWLIS